MIIATCATIAAILANAQGGETVQLRGTCPKITIRGKHYNPPITVEATKATVKGLVVNNGGGVIWKGGVLVAPQGPFAAGTPNGYGFYAYAARNVVLDRVVVRDSLKGIVIIRGSQDIQIKDSVIEYMGGDGINIANAKNTIVKNNIIRNFYPNAGYHQDGIQMWAGASNILIENNRLEGSFQGITDFGAAGDLPISNTHVINNQVHVAHYHGITLGSAVNSSIINNEVRGLNPAMKTIVRASSKVKACNNIVWDHPLLSAGVGKC